MPLTLNLRTADIRERQEIVVPGAWELKPGAQINVALAAGQSGILETIRQVDPNTWHLRWSRDTSPLDGRTFELARMVSTIAAPGRWDWNCRLRLVMPRLTREEIAKLQPRLCQWQTPADMSRLVNETGNRIGSTNLFNQGGLAFLRDGWIAGEFGRLRRADKVRLIADTWPDFDLEIGGSIERCEAVEVDDPERRRGDEYRNSTGRIEHDPVEDWAARAEHTPAWIAAACQKKAEKRYGGRASLVIYLNVGEYGIRQKEIEGCFPSATAAAKDRFDAVWVLWKNKAYLVWKDGKAPRRAA